MRVHEDQLIRDTSAQLSAEGRKVLAALYATMRSLRLYPLENQVVQRALAEVDATTRVTLNREGRLQLRMAGDFIFFNDVRVRLDLGNYASFVFVRKALEEHGIGDIEAKPQVDIREWTSFLSLIVTEPEDGENILDAFQQRMQQAGIENIKVGPAAALVEALSLSEEAKEAARRTYARSVSVVKDVMTSVRLGKAWSGRRVKRVVLGIVDQVLHDEAAMLGMTTLRDYDEYTFTHSVNVCILSVALGQKLGFSKLQLFDLGLGALFHDVGKSRVPLSVLNKDGRLDKEEWRIMSQHPEFGLVLLFDLHGFEEPPYRAMLTAYEHHMRTDFTGYPQVIRDRWFGFFSRIVAVADAFDAATSKRSYQYIPFPPDEVLREMRDNPARGFDATVVKAFVNMMGIYPVGTVCILDSGELAVVVAPSPNPEELHRPLVRIVSDASGRRLGEPPLVDLSEADPATGRPTRTIVKTTDPDKYNITISDFVA
ncbi:MAG: HD domain-containing protein [Gemmatimonadetes bacterium]|uniref:HD domain-containing protein n=1 Tax=Candidatus Kutchimonas denitrificans TaxID=3056748 RepID=A0AAE4Z8H6_9BACT|nr:HD domain-containing protein [Gemmatimonadota bacterium]NIR74607.1 HD domain-containing protein [Candidatus Kutchimonas denitrificans]NIS02797.1 HD domain-containing protein [Gemmatimonadota bacterium]NIT68958.1 HD domain-containing protein [Gemmatimonadota bacterium]NIU52263.1 HD domain-containing protein [Gemmatimonadota bacterium]